VWPKGPPESASYQQGGVLLSRESLALILSLVTLSEGRGVGFRSLKVSLGNTSAGGRLISHVFGALAEFEREIVREGTITGLEWAST
jgi:DNA invertase Pin-like site-specific DNA recombinase